MDGEDNLFRNLISAVVYSRDRPVNIASKTIGGRSLSATLMVNQVISNTQYVSNAGRMICACAPSR